MGLSVRILATTIPYDTYSWRHMSVWCGSDRRKPVEIFRLEYFLVSLEMEKAMIRTGFGEKKTGRLDRIRPRGEP